MFRSGISIKESCFGCGKKLLESQYRLCESCTDTFIEAYFQGKPAIETLKAQWDARDKEIVEIHNELIQTNYPEQIVHNQNLINKRMGDYFELGMRTPLMSVEPLDPKMFVSDPNDFYFTAYRTFYETRIASYSEIADCEETASTGDYTHPEASHGFIDRDAGATIWDSHVSHNCNVSRDLTPAILQTLVGHLRFPLRTCMITTRETYFRMVQLMAFMERDRVFPHIVDYLGLHSYYVSENCWLDTIGRIYFINIDDPYIMEPRLHGKIRDLQ